LQLDSTFSERNYGASSFLDFVEKLSQAGLVQLKHAGRSVMVELNNQFDEVEAAARPAPGADAVADPTSVAQPLAAIAPDAVQPPSPGALYGEPRRSDGGGGGFRPAQEQDVPRATEPPADGAANAATKIPLESTKDEKKRSPMTPLTV